MGKDSDACPLSRVHQTRNPILFAACTALQYFAAPVSYVGPTQASLCRALHATDDVAHLPQTASLALTLSPVILAWLAPGVAVLRRNLILCYTAASLLQALVAAALLAPFPAEVKVVAVIAQAAAAGVAMPSAIAFLWELIGRGAAESRR